MIDQRLADWPKIGHSLGYWPRIGGWVLPMGSLFPDWHQAGGLVKDWQIGIGLPFDKGIGQGLALHRRVGGLVRISIGLEDLQWIGGLLMDNGLTYL